MIFERWDTKFEIEKLREHLEKYIFPLEPVRQSPSFGGWSVLSSNGSYQDGWAMGHIEISPQMTPEAILAGMRKAGLKSISEYTLPTEICHGYLLDVIRYFHEQGLLFARARIIQLVAGLESSWHRDAPDSIPLVRLHVPIVTNSECFFEVEGDRAHLPADGSSYFIRVNRLHRVVNRGVSHRYHLVMDVKDQIGLSQYHRAPIG